MFANGDVVQDAPLIDVASEIANYSKIGLSPIEIFERLQQDYAARGMEMPRDLGMLTIERIAQQVGGTIKEDAQIDSVNFPELGGDGGLGESPYNLIPEISPERLPPVDLTLDPRLGTYPQGGPNLNPAEMPPLNTNIDIDSLLDEAQNEIKIEDDLPTKVETLGPNDVRLSDGRIVDFTKGIQDIKEGKGKGLELYRIFNSPDIERGANVDEALSQFVREDEPGFFKIVGSLGGETPEERRGGAFGPEDFGSGIVAGVKGALDVGREGLERTVTGFLEFFGGEKLGNKARDFLEGEFDEGYGARGGFNPSVIDNIVINASGSSISEDLEEIGITNETGSVVKPEVGEPEFVLDDGPEGRVGFESKKDLDDYRNSDEYKNWIEKPLDEDDFISSGESRTVPPGDEIGTKIVEAIKKGGIPQVEPDSVTPITSSTITYSSNNTPQSNFAQFTQSPDFIRFIRNLGKGMVTTGEMGKGIALGSAAAAEEKYKDENLQKKKQK